jgi:hypothetical protein
MVRKQRQAPEEKLAKVTYPETWIKPLTLEEEVSEVCHISLVAGLW